MDNLKMAVKLKIIDESFNSTTLKQTGNLKA